MSIKFKRRDDKRKKRNRFNLRKSSSTRLRLSVYRSNQNIYVQVIDDVKGNTVLSASTMDKDFQSKKIFGGNVKAAKVIGTSIATLAKDAGVKEVVFDRGSYIYHGRVKALAESARENGLEF